MIVGAVVVVVVVEVVVVVVVEVAGAVKTDVKVFTRVEVRNVTWGMLNSMETIEFGVKRNATAQCELILRQVKA